MLLKLVRLKKIAVFFPFSGSSLFRDPSLGYMVHFRASYADEAEKLVGHAYHSFGVRRFALFYQNDSFGLSALEGAKKALTAKNCEWIEAGYERNTADINPAAEKILKFNSNAILFFSNYAPSVALVHKMGVENLSNQVLMGISVITDAFRDFLHSVGLEMILSQVVPSCYDPSIPIVKEFTEDISRYDYYDSHVTPVTLESYINIAIFSMVLEKIDYPYTKEKILQQFELIKNINFKGLHLDFNPATRSLSNRVWIDRGYSEPWMTD
jgi:ABC-type branched-subunit amino acid transport system substrate-binding protein